MLKEKDSNIELQYMLFWNNKEVCSWLKKIQLALLQFQQRLDMKKKIPQFIQFVSEMLYLLH